MTRYLKHVVLDSFLPADLRESILSYVLENRDKFVPTSVDDQAGHQSVNTDFRRSWLCSDGLGEFKRPFKAIVRSKIPELVQELGMSSFPLAGIELELVAHRNGSFFHRHIDTATQHAREKRTTDRVVSAVYYFHAHPKQFSGGELGIAPLGGSELRLVDPIDNRLVVFPSFVPHEVRPVVCEIDDFCHARFAVNCWLHKARVDRSHQPVQTEQLEDRVEAKRYEG